jgi:BASS family bile acid:Na+ symporter
MQSSLALSVGLPAALVIIMLGLGLSLRLEDFTRVLARPWPVVVGLFCHILLLPALCFALVKGLGLPAPVAMGMMLLAASPGGTSAALYTHLARGDVALSLSMAAFTSMLALLTLPVIVNLSLFAFYGETSDVRLEIAQVLQIFAIAIVPALIGVLIRSRYPALAARLDKPVKTLATIFLALVVVFALISQWSLLSSWGPAVGAVVVAFNLIALAVGYFLPRLLGVERRQAVALSMSTSIRNAALVIALAMSEFMLNDPELAIPPAAYGLVAYIVGGVAVWIMNRRQPAM